MCWDAGGRECTPGRGHTRTPGKEVLPCESLGLTLSGPHVLWSQYVPHPPPTPAPSSPLFHFP